MRRAATATMAAAFLVGGLSSAPPAVAAPAPEFTPEPIAWGPCEDESLRQAGGECGMLEVPLDYREPDGERIPLAVSRIEHTVPEDQYQGVMLVNPGGPGGSGLSLPVLGKYVPHGAGAAYDWIGFDPRGVGSSKPALSCDPDYSYDRPEYVPSTPELEAEWLSRSGGYAEYCNDKLISGWVS